MAADEKWYFTKEQLMSAPSRKYGYDADKELSCRQQAANFIQDMGQRLQVTQLCINTAIVYMHRFYMFHSFTQFHRNHMASAALFLAAKVEEQPRKLEHVIKVSQICLHRDMAPPDVKSPAYNEQAQELVVNENILLQTLGFDVAIDHPHTHVVKCCHLVRASKDLAQTSYFMASNSLHLTTMCLQYKPTVVACFCIHLACKWSNWEIDKLQIPQSTEGKAWFWYIDKTVTQELLEQLTEEFLGIFDKCPSRLKKKIVSLSQSQNPTILSQFNDVRSSKDDKKRNGDGSLSGPGGSSSSEDMKKKAEFQRHHPPDYKKHHMSHHSRPDSMNVSSKSSCMFGPPQRTQPSSHSNVSSSHRSIQKTSVPDLSNLGKPEHLHHRPRRPDDKHSRNHEHIPTPYKKFDKVPSGVVNEFPQTGPVSSRSAVNFNTTTPTSYQIAQQPPQLPMHPPVSAVPEQQNVKDSLPLLPTVPKPVAPLPQKTKVVSPPVIKTERSIFSPEKCTPPPESLVKPLPPSPPPSNVSTNMNYMHKIPHIKEEYIVPKQELITPIDIKQEISISPIEEKPPDLGDFLEEQPVAVKIEAVPTPTNPSQSIAPPEEHYPHKEKKEKKKKKHKEHKEHKDKHKDKHKHKHKNRDPEPIVITIPKEKLTLPPPEQGLKIKIARDKITAPMESPLKIKISQGKIKESKKRDRSEERSPGLPTKYHRPNGTTTLQVTTELDILECSSVKPNNVSVEVHSPPSVCLDDIETIIDELPLSPTSDVVNSSNNLDSIDELLQEEAKELPKVLPSVEEVEKPKMTNSYNSVGPPRGTYHEHHNPHSERSSKYPYDHRGSNMNLGPRGNYRGEFRGDMYRGRGRGGFRGTRGGYRGDFPGKTWAPRAPRPPGNHYNSRGGYIIQPPHPIPRHHQAQPHQQYFHPHSHPQFQPQQQFYQHQPTYFVPQYPPPPPLPDDPPPEIPPPPPPE